MEYTDVSLEDIVKGRMSPVDIGGEEKTVKMFRYVNSVSMPAPVDSQSPGNIQSIPLGTEKDMNKMRFFYFRGDFKEQELAEIAKIVQDGYDINTGKFRDDKTLERKLGSYGIRDYERKDIARGEMDIDDTVDKKIPSIPMDIQVVFDGEKIFFRYSVNYGPFVFSDIAKTVNDGYMRVKKTFTDEDRKEEDYYDALTRKLNEDIGHELKQYQSAFGIDDAHLISAIDFGLDGRPLTPPPSIIFDFDKIYSADDKGKIHIPEDDPVVRAIIKMILEGKSTLVDKTVVESHKSSSSAS